MLSVEGIATSCSFGFFIWWPGTGLVELNIPVFVLGRLDQLNEEGLGVDEELDAMTIVGDRRPRLGNRPEALALQALGLACKVGDPIGYVVKDVDPLL